MLGKLLGILSQRLSAILQYKLVKCMYLLLGFQTWVLRDVGSFHYVEHSSCVVECFYSVNKNSLHFKYFFPLFHKTELQSDVFSFHNFLCSHLICEDLLEAPSIVWCWGAFNDILRGTTYLAALSLITEVDIYGNLKHFYVVCRWNFNSSLVQVVKIFDSLTLTSFAQWRTCGFLWLLWTTMNSTFVFLFDQVQIDFTRRQEISLDSIIHPFKENIAYEFHGFFVTLVTIRFCIPLLKHGGLFGIYW